MKYILPNFYDSFIYNKLLKEDFFTTVNIEGIQGTYPFCIFNGGCNNIEYEEIALYIDLINGLGQYGILGNKILLDFGNINLEEKDYVNTFGNLIVETFYTNSCFYFLVSQENFIEYLINKYPNIQFILHQNYINFQTEQEIQKCYQCKEELGEYYEKLVINTGEAIELSEDKWNISVKEFK